MLVGAVLAFGDPLIDEVWNQRLNCA
jgi:hypothetical protein